MPLLRYKVLLITSILFIVAGFLLTAFSLFSPLWQIVDIPQNYVSHQHGLWWDCVISQPTDERIIPLTELESENRGDSCVSKFEPSVTAVLRTALDNGDATSRELMMHRFLPHHKAVIFFSVFAFVFGIIAVVIGACSPCFPPNSLMYIVATFMTSACSLLADVLFFLGTFRDEENINQHPFETRLGLACYTHVLATTVFAIALLLSVLSSYVLITSKRAHDSCCISRRDYVEHQKWKSQSERRCDRKNCRPFVVVDDDSSL